MIILVKIFTKIILSHTVSTVYIILHKCSLNVVGFYRIFL